MVSKRVSALLEKYIPDKDPVCLVDVGAIGGLEKEWEEIKPHIQAIGFEPDERGYQQLKSTPKTLFFNEILWSEKKDLNFYITKQVERSSIYEPNFDFLEQFPDSDRFSVEKKVTISSEKVTTLDSLFGDDMIPDFIKLDTQGSELDILKGSEKVLRKSIVGIKVEVEFGEMYKKQPLFSDVDSYLRSQGFELIDLQRVFMKRKEYTRSLGRGQLVFGDALYFKKIPVFLETLKENEDAEENKIKAIKFISISLLYGMNDYAIALLKECYKQGIIPQDGYDSILKGISAGDKKYRFFLFPGARYLVALFIRLTFFLKKNNFEWSDADPFLGNRCYFR